MKPKSAPVESITPLILSPAHWDYHPAAPETGLAAAPLGAEGCVLTSEGGQRWVSRRAAEAPASAAEREAPAKDAPAATRCAGRAEASAFPAPEELPSIVRRGERSWIFVGESGTLYLADEPLGPFVRTVPPPEPFARVSGAGSVLLATTLQGGLLRWEDASGWRPVTLAPAAGRPAPRVFDVVVEAGGRALALAFPEALLTSGDGGASWAPLPAPTIGARSLGRSASGELGAQGLLESLIVPADRSAGPRRERDGLSAPSIELALGAGRGASASAVLAGRAAMDGDRYAEVIRPANEGDEWALAKGRIEGALESSPLPGTGKCGNLALGLRGKHLALACTSSEDDRVTLELRVSHDLGASFGTALELTTNDTNLVKLVVAPSGAVLLTGACSRAPAEAEADTSCRPTAPLLVRAEGEALRAIASASPSLTATALVPAFSLDGQSAYFVARRGKDDKMSLFVSHDGGETFSARPLDLPITPTPPRPRSDEDEEGAEVDPSDDTLELDDGSFLRPGEDGTLGLMVTRSRGPTYLTLDDDGHVQRAASPPSDSAQITGVGRRLLAFAFIEGREPEVSFWESSDGGSTWDEQAASPALGRELSRTSLGLACSPSGCLLGDVISLVGWGASPEVSALDRASIDRGPPAPASSAPSVLTPLVCELAPKTRWARIDGSFGAGGASVTFPDVNEIVRGRSLWSVLTEDAGGAIGTVSGVLPDAGDGEATIVTRALLGRRGAGESATDITRQMEGFAAVRVSVPLDKDGELRAGTAMRNVEVAWQNDMTGALVHAKIPDAGPFDAHDIEGDPGERQLVTGLITVTPSGLLVTPHSPRSGDRRSFFIDAKGKLSPVELPILPSSGLGGLLDLRADAVDVGGQLLAVGMALGSAGETTTLLLAPRVPAAQGQPERWPITATTLLPRLGDEGPLRAHTEWTYEGPTTVGITTLVADRLRGRGWAYFQAFRADGTLGAALPQATLGDLGDRPRPCTAAERASSARFESRFFAQGEPLFPGQRHPVLVTEAKAGGAALPPSPLVLLTGDAVVHGPPSAPCIAGWEARALGHAPMMAVVGGDLKHAWLFRLAPPPPGQPSRPHARAGATRPSLEHRPMVCRYDPTARIPDAIWGEPGTSIPER